MHSLLAGFVAGRAIYKIAYVFDKIIKTYTLFIVTNNTMQFEVSHMTQGIFVLKITTAWKYYNSYYIIKIMECMYRIYILNAISYAPHILLMTAEVNESQFLKFSFQFIWHWSHNNTFKRKLFCRIPVFLQFPGTCVGGKNKSHNFAT